jgi:hypothetical protein
MILNCRRIYGELEVSSPYGTEDESGITPTSLLQNLQYHQINVSGENLLYFMVGTREEYPFSKNI